MEGSKLDGSWKVPRLVANGVASCLVINGRFQTWWPLEGNEKTSFSPLSTFHPIRFYLNFFPLILGFYFTMVLNHYFAYFFSFPWPINYNHASQITKSSTHSSSSWFWSKIFPFFEFMVLHMITFYGLQATQMNEEPPQKSSLNLTLT
jgi:hypothetical protein